MLTLPNCSADDRNTLIADLAAQGINTNVHYKPLPMLTAYRDMGFNASDFPNATRAFENEVTLPLYSVLDPSDALWVAESVVSWMTAKGYR